MGESDSCKTTLGGDVSSGCHQPQVHGNDDDNKAALQRSKKRCWSLGQNMELVYCYFLAKPEVSKYRRRMHEIWIRRGNDPSLSEQNLADQRSAVMSNNRIPIEKLNELRCAADSVDCERPNYTKTTHREESC